MGGPGGVTGQPSTWITQLVEGLLRHTEEPGWLPGWMDGWLAGWLTPTQGPPHTHIIFTHRHKCTYSFLPDLSSALSHSCTPGPVQTCGISAVRTHDSMLDSISSVVSQWRTHGRTHTGRRCFPLGRRGACCPSSVISSSLPPAISVPSALSALPPLLVSSHMATTPIPHPPMPSPRLFPLIPPPPLFGASLTALNAPLSHRITGHTILHFKHMLYIQYLKLMLYTYRHLPLLLEKMK